MMKLKSIDASLILRWIVKDIFKIIGLGVTFSVIAIVYALSLPNEYSASVVTASNMDKGNKSAGLSGLGGLASLAGVNLGGGDTYSPEVLQKMLLSTSILASFARTYELVPEIMAVESYSLKSNSFSYKESIYDPRTGEWTRKVMYPATQEPSDSEIAHELRQKLNVTYDRATKLISVSYRSYSPEFAPRLVTSLIEHLNQQVRVKERLSTERTIQDIEKILEEANSIEVKVALQSILEEQYKKLTLARTRPEYALMTVEPAFVPFMKSGPNRAVLCLLIVFIGVAASTLLMWTVRIIKSDD